MKITQVSEKIDAIQQLIEDYRFICDIIELPIDLPDIDTLTYAEDVRLVAKFSAENEEQFLLQNKAMETLEDKKTNILSRIHAHRIAIFDDHFTLILRR